MTPRQFGIVCAFLVSLAVGGTACQPSTVAGPEEKGTSSPSQLPRVLTEHRPAPTTAASSKALGDDCTAHGASECRSRLCLHVGAREAGYVCSQACEDNSSCPTHWECRFLSLSNRRAVCVPPAEKKS